MLVQIGQHVVLLHILTVYFFRVMWGGGGVVRLTLLAGFVHSKLNKYFFGISGGLLQLWPPAL